MIIITSKGQVNTETDPVVLIFNDDDEMNKLLLKISTTPVLTSGFRIVSLVEQHNLTPLQQSLLNIITGLDGVGNKSEKTNTEILDNTIDSLKDILNQQP